MRPYQYFCFLVAFVLICTGVAVFHNQYREKLFLERIDEEQSITALLGFSDLVLSTEARYIRHLSLADGFSPFQDIPSGFDIFPSGSFYLPIKDIFSGQRKCKGKNL